jgi:hypothetical protein
MYTNPSKESNSLYFLLDWKARNEYSILEGEIIAAP